MANETVNQETTQAAEAANSAAAGAPAANTAAAPASAAAQRTFTQDELNSIVADRVRREANKYADYESVKTELANLKAANAIRDIREQVASAKKIPAALLTGDTKEACEQQADAILAFAKPAQTAPVVPDSGEVTHAGGGKTRDQFSDWFQENFK